MCKAFVKLSRPFGDQSGGARKWAIRAGCETWFANGGCRPPSASDKRMSISPPPGNKAGKAKATARAKQLAIGTSGYHQRSPKMSHKVKQESYLTGPGGGPSTGAAYDGTSRPVYPSYHYSYQQQHPASYPPGYHYIPIQHNSHPHPHAHPMMQSYSYQQNGGYQAQPPAGSPSEDASPLMIPAGHSAPHPYPQYAYAQPGPPQQYWTAPGGDHKPSYASMPPPAHAYIQSDERNSQHEQHSPASYDGQHSPQGMRGREPELSLSPTQ
jgi:hypothetical protein